MGSTVDLSWPKEETLNLMIGKKRLCCLKNKERRKRRKLKRCTEMWDTKKHTHTRIMGVPEVGGQTGAEKNI